LQKAGFHAGLLALALCFGAVFSSVRKNPMQQTSQNNGENSPVFPNLLTGYRDTAAPREHPKVA
jgi:hypothetical protein